MIPRTQRRFANEGKYAVRCDQDARAQSCLTLHRTRHLFIRQQTAVINVIGPTLPIGIVAPVGRKGVEALLDSRQSN